MTTPTFCTKCGERLTNDAVTDLCANCLRLIASSVFRTTTADAHGGQTTSQESDPLDTTGTTIQYLGNYELQKLIGRGGVAEVYLARQLNLGRHVAVKVLRQDLEDDESVKLRFKNEATLAAKLGYHPNIVPVYEPGEHGGRCFFSMEFVDGMSLAEKLKAGPIPFKDAVRYVAASARAIHFAHEKGLVHRDIKPANILIDAFDTPRITDFGMAKDVHAPTGLTKTDQLVGTLNYMAPEQIEFRFGDVGPRSDIYSLGATLYQLLTTVPPFYGDSPAGTLRLITSNEPIPLSKLSPTLPPDLQTICLKCLEKSQSLRYCTALELAEDLDRFLENRPIRARTPNGIVRTVKWARRNSGWATSIAVAIFAAMCGITALLWHNARLEQQVWKSLLSEAQAHLSAKDRQRALETLRAAAAMQKNPAIRRQAIEAITEAGISFINRVSFSSPHQILFSPDNQLLAIAGTDTVWVTNAMKSFVAAVGATNQPQKVGIQSGTLSVWDLSRHRMLNTTSYDPSAGPISWSPNGELIAVPGSNHVVNLWNPKSAADHIKVQASGWCFFSPEGDFLAVGRTNDTKIFRAGTGEIVAHRPTGLGMAFLDRSSVFVQEPNALVLWNVLTGAERTIGKGRVLRISGNHRAIVMQSDATNGLPGAVELIELPSGVPVGGFPTDTKAELITSIDARGVLFSIEDPGRVARTRIWNARTKEFDADLREDVARTRRMPAPPRSNVPSLFPDIRLSYPWAENSGYCSMSKDANYFAAERLEPDGDSVVSVWNLKTGEKIRTLRSSELPTWSGDGRFLAVRGGTVARTHSSPLMIWQIHPGVFRYQLPNPVYSLRFVGTQLEVNGNLFRIQFSREKIDVLPMGSFPGLHRHFGPAGGWELRNETRGIFLRKLFPSPKEAVIPPPFERAALISYAVSESGKRIALFFWSMDEGGIVPSAYFSDAVQKKTEVQIWDSESCRQVAKWSEDDRSLTLGRGAGASAFSADDKQFASVIFFKEKIEIRETDTGRLLRTQELAPVRQRTVEGGSNPVKPPARTSETNMVVAIDPRWTVTDVVFSHGGKLLVFAQGVNVVLADATTGRILRICEGHQGIVRSLAISRDDRVLATGAEDRSIHLWELPSGRELASWEAYSSDTSALAFSADGKFLASGSSLGTLKLWNIPHIRQELARLGLDW